MYRECWAHLHILHCPDEVGLQNKNVWSDVWLLRELLWFKWDLTSLDDPVRSLKRFESRVVSFGRDHSSLAPLLTCPTLLALNPFSASSAKVWPLSDQPPPPSSRSTVDSLFPDLNLLIHRKLADTLRQTWSWEWAVGTQECPKWPECLAHF